MRRLVLFYRLLFFLLFYSSEIVSCKVLSDWDIKQKIVILETDGCLIEIMASRIVIGSEGEADTGTATEQLLQFLFFISIIYSYFNNLTPDPP